MFTVNAKLWINKYFFRSIDDIDPNEMTSNSITLQCHTTKNGSINWPSLSFDLTPLYCFL